MQFDFWIPSADYVRSGKNEHSPILLKDADMAFKSKLLKTISMYWLENLNQSKVCI